MGTFIGALLGAVTVALVGRGVKGRDFTGLAVAMFFFSLVVCVGLSPIFFASEKQAAAQMALDGRSGGYLNAAGVIVAGIIAFLTAAVPGLVFAGTAKRD